MLKDFKKQELISAEILFKTKNLAINAVLILSFAILTGISAGLKVEIGPVPITMQTFVVLLSGVLLGSKRGAISQFSYLLGGLAGIPWFSRGGGSAYVLSPTFGYIVGFICSAYLIGVLTEKNWNKNIVETILVVLTSTIVLYIPGLLWLCKFVGASKVLAVGFYPFILGDALKIFLISSILFSKQKIRL